MDSKKVWNLWSLHTGAVWSDFYIMTLTGLVAVAHWHIDTISKHFLGPFVPSHYIDRSPAFWAESIRAEVGNCWQNTARAFHEQYTIGDSMSGNNENLSGGNVINSHVTQVGIRGDLQPLLIRCTSSPEILFRSGAIWSTKERTTWSPYGSEWWADLSLLVCPPLGCRFQATVLEALQTVHLLQPLQMIPKIYGIGHLCWQLGYIIAKRDVARWAIHVLVTRWYFVLVYVMI